MTIYQLYNPGANSHYMFTIKGVSNGATVVIGGYVKNTYITLYDFVVMME